MKNVGHVQETKLLYHRIELDLGQTQMTHAKIALRLMLVTTMCMLCNLLFRTP